ncbi:hypothetical protein LV82_00755 [Albidovulum inexpectatum]|uniref:Uncharacterized protein n=1 Tax=Albidovulum inexpectatum TaxID=196587 RepID=A0A2S5JJ57_9RHOB|nr:hypothetical protein [Albidovulum inexpectatum]PPB81546.1 hypothetical protein LV82_00755 [Albidovulum inexpectatum]
MFQWRDDRQISAFDRSIVFLVQALTGLAFLGLSMRYFAGLFPWRAVDSWAPRDWALAQSGILAFGAALLFLLPALFDRLLYLCRGGRLRLLIAIGFVLLLPFLAEFALWLGMGPESPIGGQMRPETLLWAFAAYAPAYVYAFVVPGRAFDRVRPIVPEHVFIVPGKPARLRRDYGAMDLARAGMLGLIILFWAVGIAGLYFLNWLPEPELVSTTERYWFVSASVALLASLFAFSGPLAGSDESTFRTIARRGLLVLTAAIMTYSLAAPTLTRGLPWLHSQLPAAGAEASRIEVTVMGRKGTGRGRACDRAAIVTVAGAGERPVVLCSLPGNIWQGLQPGDKLLLSGVRTPWGMRFDSIQDL